MNTCCEQPKVLWVKREKPTFIETPRGPKRRLGAKVQAYVCANCGKRDR
jgi:hypothetical protein